MIPSLAVNAPFVQRPPEWPVWPPPDARITGALFEARPAFRRLIVLADADVLAASGDDDELSPARLLSGLLTHPYTELFRYRDDGPPHDATHKCCGPANAGLSVAPGWAELQPADGDGVRGILYQAGQRIRESVVFGAGVQHAEGDTSTASYRDREPADAAAQRGRDVLAAEVAQAMGADLFITERPYLFDRANHAVPGVTLCHLPEGLAAVALYLRSQHEFITWRASDGTGQRVMNEWLYYQVGAIALLPELWRWSAARDQIGTALDGEALNKLQGAVVQRILRALRTRDGFHRVCSLPQSRDVMRTMLFELDTLLVTLMGAIDASARFVHVLLDLPTGQRRRAGWQNTDWLTKLATKDQRLAKLFEPSTELRHVLTVLSRLRNTVHGDVLQAITVQKGWAREAPIRLPKDQEEEILTCLDAAGGRTAWGVRTAADKSAVVDPVTFVERLFPAIVALLNVIMEHTPGISNGGQPQSDTEHPWYNHQNRTSIRWQLGM